MSNAEYNSGCILFYIRFCFSSIPSLSKRMLAGHQHGVPFFWAPGSAERYGIDAGTRPCFQEAAPASMPVSGTGIAGRVAAKLKNRASKKLANVMHQVVGRRVGP